MEPTKMIVEIKIHFLVFFIFCVQSNANIDVEQKQAQNLLTGISSDNNESEMFWFDLKLKKLFLN